MKKRFLSLFLVLALLCAITISASAASMTGSSSGGEMGILNVTATLECARYYASATTRTVNGSYASLMRTTVRFNYVNSSWHDSTLTISGYSSAYAEPSDMGTTALDTSATSQHSCRGGSDWGTWSCSLSA